MVPRGIIRSAGSIEDKPKLSLMAIYIVDKVLDESHVYCGFRNCCQIKFVNILLSENKRKENVTYRYTDCNNFFYIFQIFKSVFVIVNIKKFFK